MKIIAHRSGPSLYPEQTIASALHAQNSGADMIEIDVRFTKDKRIAVTHDKNLDRVFGVNIELDQLSAIEFLALRHKAHPAFASHLFEDYLASGVKPLLIHIKEDDVIEALIALIEKYQYTDKVVFGVHNTALANHIKKRDPAFKVLAFMPELKDIDAFGATDVDYIRLWEQWCSEENISRIRSYGKEVWIMTNGSDVGVTTVEALRKILSLKVDGILINDIECLIPLIN